MEPLIRRAYGAFAARDLAALSELAAPEVEVETVTGMLAGHDEPYRGYQGLERYLADIAEVWRRLELFPKEFVELDAERVLVFGRVRAWHRRGFVDSANAWVWTVRDARVVRVQVFASPADARRFVAEPAARLGDEASDL